jgi:ribosome-binding protein aMBF1 (putative translation factor)
MLEGRRVLPRTSTSAAKRSRAQAKTVDTYVGQRIRDKRNERSMSQTEVSSALGVTFQQMQKYERGINRVDASRLYDLSQILKVRCNSSLKDWEISRMIWKAMEKTSFTQ